MQAISRGFIGLSYFPRSEFAYPVTGELHPANCFDNGNLAQEWARKLFGGASRNIINEDNEAAVPALLIRDNVDLAMAPGLAA